MILAHISETHLGYRAHHRSEGGRNLREKDVLDAFHRTIREVIRLEPAAVLFAGDVFDRPDPAPGALVALARGLEAMRAALPDTHVLLVAGARDRVRGDDPGALAALDAFPHVEAASLEPRSVFLHGGRLHVRLVPHAAEEAVSPTPSREAEWNVLLAHARIVDRKAHDTGVLDPTGWDYVALGGDHRRRRVAPRVHQAGSIERVGVDPWVEAEEEKGFLTFDLESGTSRFHRIPGRPVASLAPVDFSRRAVDGVRKVLDEVPGGIDDRVVRLPVAGLPARGPDDETARVLAGLAEGTVHLAVERRDPDDTPVPDLGDWLEAEAEGAGVTAEEAARVAERIQSLLAGAR